jgi:hypothetical protein
MPSLKDLVPDVETLVGLDPEELGLILLRILDDPQNQQNGLIHPGNFELRQFPPSGGGPYSGQREAEAVEVVREALRAVKLLVAEHLAEPALLGRAPRKSVNRRARDAALAMRRASPTITLQEIGRQLQAMAIPSARGQLTWSASMVAQLLKPTALDAARQ